MDIFVLGATGMIGNRVARDLVLRGHVVQGLCRNTAKADDLRRAGVTTVLGDMLAPDRWVEQAARADCVIQLAATFGDDMGEVDMRAMMALADRARAQGRDLRILYTGGCWLFGDTGGKAVVESDPHNPIASFAWMDRTTAELAQHDHIALTVAHPAMVYTRSGGAIARYFEAARAGRPVEVWGSVDIHWPLVHLDDLVRGYVLLTENPDMCGAWNIASQPAVRTGAIAQAISDAYGTGVVRIVDRRSVLAAQGDWAEGPMLNQGMCAAKLCATGLWQPEVTDFLTSDVFADRAQREKSRS